MPDAVPAQPATPPPAGVAVLGEALVDQFADGSAVPGGAPFNVARWLGAFGVPTLFITRLGRDDAAATLRRELRRFGLPLHGVQADDRLPTGAVRVLPDTTPGGGGHRFEIAAASAWDAIDAATALPLLQAAALRFVCFGTLALRSAGSRTAITQLVQATAALRLVDLNLRPVPELQALAAHALGLADWVKVNEAELHTLLQWFGADGTVPAFGTARHAQAWQALGRRFGVQRWIVTLGEQGWATADDQGRIDARGQGLPVARVQDTVGAGDAFTATVLAGLAHGWPLARSLAASNQLAAAACTWRGALPADDAVLAHWRHKLGLAEPAAGQPSTLHHGPPSP